MKNKGLDLMIYFLLLNLTLILTSCETLKKEEPQLKKIAHEIVDEELNNGDKSKS